MNKQWRTGTNVMTDWFFLFWKICLEFFDKEYCTLKITECFLNYVASSHTPH